MALRKSHLSKGKSTCSMTLDKGHFYPLTLANLTRHTDQEKSKSDEERCTIMMIKTNTRTKYVNKYVKLKTLHKGLH
jgi:hypothetical protein